MELGKDNLPILPTQPALHQTEGRGLRPRFLRAPAVNMMMTSEDGARKLDRSPDQRFAAAGCCCSASHIADFFSLRSLCIGDYSRKDLNGRMTNARILDS